MLPIQSVQDAVWLILPISGCKLPYLSTIRNLPTTLKLNFRKNRVNMGLVLLRAVRFSHEKTKIAAFSPVICGIQLRAKSQNTKCRRRYFRRLPLAGAFPGR